MAWLLPFTSAPTGTCHFNFSSVAHLAFRLLTVGCNRLGRLRCLVDGRTPEGSRRPGDPAYRWSQHIATLQDATTSATTTITKACHSATMTMGPALALSSRIAFRPKVLSVASRLLGVWLTFFLGYSYIMDGPAGAKRTKLVLFSILFDEMHYQHSFHSILFRFMLL